ncbi:hypothetical protein CBR_g50584 [Chara braunii]|uniref:Integrase catalytic domain-containing protein n=1 Tax=Chara braunii TaxID=69332 RepID=A0A388M727_CHABU|nr:hypothetical protein CBR_g50584 [Chara braunii]|eukprot:GBG90336.1 hypothetical protein CBR_g50584 [Chara braunii]
MTGSSTPISVTLGDDKTQRFFDQTVTDLPFFLTLEATDHPPVSRRHRSSAHFDVIETRARALAAPRETANAAAREQAAAAARAAAMTSSAASSAALSGTNGTQEGMPTGSTGTSSSLGSCQSTSQMAGSQFSPLTPRERELRELQQVERIRERLERELKQATDREREIKNRAARLDMLEADKAELEGLDESGLSDQMKVLKNNMLSLHAHVDSRLDFMQNTLDQILDILQRPGYRPPAQSPLPLTAMSGPFPFQAGTQPSGTSAAAAQTVASSSSGRAVRATPLQQPVPPQGQPQGQWYPKTPMKPPLAFSGERKDEELNTWLRTVPVWVKAKRTLPEDEVVTAASYLEVMPFGLCNAPGTFQHTMNQIFHDHLDNFIIVYLDDILIFSKSAEEHAQHVETVLSLQRQHKYKVNLKKCEFGRTKILYLGHEVSAEGIRPEDAKVASILDWRRPQTVTEVRSFLGMCGYYRKFVKNYSTVASPLTDLTRLDTPWDWSDECEGAFKRLKHTLMNHEVLMVLDPQKPFIVTTDASQYGTGPVLAQQDGKKLRPIEYMSKKMPSKKLAKSTYERELYALYKALVHWRHFLLGRFFYLRTDHQTLKWIKTQPALYDAFKRWVEVIDQYDFKLEYLKGEYNKVADALSCRADYLGALVSDFGVSEEVTQSLVGAYQEDPVTMDIMGKLQAKDKATESEFVMVDRLLYLDKAGVKRLVVPSSERLRSLFLGECHDATGHFGYKKTSVNLVQQFWWPGMLEDAKKYVETCQVCQRDKPRTQAPLGLLKPLPIPTGPGQSVSMDFMDTLVTSKSGKRHIFVRLVAMPETARTDHVILLFMNNWDDWDEKLPLIASLYNNAVHSSTGISPNQLHLGWKPRSALDFLLPENRSSTTPGTLEYGVQYEKLLQQAVEHIKKAQQAMIASENKHRRQSSFLVGERVWVKASELGQEFVGDEMDGPTYVIRIPGHLRTHPVFHASKLAPFAETDQFSSRRSMLPPTMDGQVDIDDIVDHKDLPVQKPLGRGRPPKPKREYRVRFRHHTDPKEDRWFTREELIDTTPQVLAEYEKKLKGKAHAKRKDGPPGAACVFELGAGHNGHRSRESILEGNPGCDDEEIPDSGENGYGGRFSGSSEEKMATYNDFLREFTLVALRIPGVTDRIMSKYFLRQFSEFDKDKILSAYQQTSKFVNTRDVDFSTVTDQAEKTIVTETLALLKEGEVIDLTGRTCDKVKKGIESLHERVHGVDNKIERVENALLVMQAQVSRPALPPQEAVVLPGVANRGFGRTNPANEQCEYYTAVGHFVCACPKLNHDILKRRCTRSLKGEIFGPQGERVNWNSPGGMRRAIIMLNGLEIAAVEAEPVIDIIWDQLRGRGPQVNFILENDGRDRVNATTRLGTAGRRIIRDTVMEEVAGSSVPQAEPEAGEPEKVYGKPREEEPTNKVTAAKKKFRYQIPILTMPEMDDTLSKLLGTMISVSFQTMLQASPRLLKGLGQLLTRWRVEIDENPELPEGEGEEEAPQEVANLQRSRGDLEDLEKAFADIHLSLPDREGGEIMRAPPGTKLSFHALPVGKLKIQIGTHHTDALVDGGAEITIVRRDFAAITGCTVNKEVTGSIRGANREISFAGYVTKCAVKAGIRESIWSFQRMTIMEEMDHDIILGRPWCANVEMIGMHLHDGMYMVDIENPVTGRGELLRLLGTAGDPPKGKLATWSPSFEDSARKGGFARMEGMRERVEIMIEEAFNKKEWIKMGLPQKKRRQEDEVLGVMVAERESKVELGASLPKRKEVRVDVPKVALEIPNLLQLIKAIRFHNVGVDSATLAKFEREVQKGYCLNGKLVSIQPRTVEVTRVIPAVHFLGERSRKEVFENLAKTDKISQWPTPLRTTTEVRAFLGVVDFWRIFIKSFAKIVEPIRAMIREEGTMDWTEEREGAVQTLKDILTFEQVALFAPCFNDEVGRPFILETDGGPLAVGGMLIQKDEEGNERPIRFESRTLNSAERWYSQFKKEVLTILHCLTTFQAYLFGRRFILRIDPTNVAGTLKNYRPIDPTVGRWVGFIWQLDYKIERIAGIRNEADGLSRVCITPEGVEDAEPIDAFLEYEEETLAVDNEMMAEECASGELLIRTLEKGAPTIVAELREGPVITRGRQEEKDLWGAMVGSKEELIAMAVEVDARDNLSGFVAAVARKKKTGRSVADWIEDFYLRHPFIKRFIEDNVTKFVNQEVLGMVKRLCVPIKLIEPYHPEANVPVEKGHRTLKNTIAKLAADNLGSWPRYLKQTVFSENMTPKRTTGCILAELWYGREIDFPVEALIPAWNRLDDDPRMTTEELIEARCQQVLRNEEVMEGIANRVQDSRMRDKARWDQVKNVRKEPLQLGETVLLRNSALESTWSGQLGRRFKGPYRVAKRVGLNTFELY